MRRIMADDVTTTYSIECEFCETPMCGEDASRLIEDARDRGWVVVDSEYYGLSDATCCPECWDEKKHEGHIGNRGSQGIGQCKNRPTCNREGVIDV